MSVWIILKEPKSWVLVGMEGEGVEGMYIRKGM